MAAMAGNDRIVGNIVVWIREATARGKMRQA
jgi:hypothetical protein